MTTVSDTSPLFNLAVIDHAHLLPELYGEVSIPSAVDRELATLATDHAGVAGIRSADWLARQPVSNRSLTSALERDLDAGEAEAIALAAETEAALLLMDERLGRRIATRLDLRYMGLLGMLVHAKRAGLIDQVRPLLQRLRTEAGFWMSDALIRRVLEAAHEGG